jgi:hypothetical protein
VADQEPLTSMDNLYRLSVNRSRQYNVRNFRIVSEDLELLLLDGTIYTVDTDRGAVGLVLLGQGQMTFTPGPETEQGQVRLFAGSEALRTPFEAAYVRAGDLTLHADVASMQPAAVDERTLRRAEGFFAAESPKASALDFGELTSEPWTLLSPRGDFVAEIQTRRYDTLTYVRARAEPEDVSLFDRVRQRNIAVYASAEKLATRGRFYHEDELAAYDVLDYEIDLAVAVRPERQFLEGEATLRLRVRASAINQISLRLASSLTVHSIVSPEFGRLFNVRVRNQSTVIVTLPAAVPQDTDFSLIIAYSGPLQPQPPDRETLDQRSRDVFGNEIYVARGEPTYLYSNRSNWYPQPPITDFATAVIRITVADGLACIATGEPGAGSPTLLPASETAPARRQFVFYANRPVRYLSFIVSRFVRADRTRVPFEGVDAEPSTAPGSGEPMYDSLELMVDAHPFQVARAGGMRESAAAIARFYQSVVGDSPYQTFTLALVESALPGGHSPAYFAALNVPLPNTSPVFRVDPVSFRDIPDFFLAHEVAHQWWGQAIGGSNYHEQWLSEGFSQYFAGLYVEHAYGPSEFPAFLRQLRQWAMDRSDQGPVYLGYRLGHVRDEPQVFRALVYNKGAAVLHMLRRLIGDDAFFRGVRRFYAGSRFTKVGTEDLRTAMEAESGRPLARFFERWIYGASLPEVTLSYRVETSAAGSQELVLRVEQTGEIFDLPLSITLRYADRREKTVSVPVTDRVVETRLPLEGSLRDVQFNRDDGTLADVRVTS